MNQTPGLLGATVRGTRKGLPRLSVLVISASVAYGALPGWRPGSRPGPEAASSLSM